MSWIRDLVNPNARTWEDFYRNRWQHDRVEMVADPDAKARVDTRLGRFGIPDGARLVVLHVSAGNPFRRWPESAFRTAAH